MKNTSKFPILMLCIVLLTVMFAGCGPKTPQTSATPGNTGAVATPVPTENATEAAKYMKAGETYRILVWNTTREDEPLELEGIRGDLIREAYNRMADDYGVKPLYLAATTTWMNDALDSSYAGNPITDLIHIAAPYCIPGFYSYNGERGAALEAASDYDIDFSDPEYWDQDTQAIGTFNGKRYLITANAIGFDAVSLNVATFFNKNLIQKGGYTAQQLYDWSNNGEWTFDKFREVARQCTDLDNGVYGTSTVASCLLLTSLVVANGSDVLVKKDGMDTFNLLDAKAIRAINFMIEMARDDKSLLVDGISYEGEHFAAGMLALMVTYINRLDMPSVKEMEDDYGIIMPPKGPDAEDYISDKNWFDGYLVMKNIPNPAGAFEFASLYFKPAYALSSQVQADMMTAQATGYGLDEQSVAILQKIPSVNHTTSYQVYWSMQVNGKYLGTIINGQFEHFVDGALTPEAYYASMESVANTILSLGL